MLDKNIVPQIPVKRLANRRRSRPGVFRATDEAGFIIMWRPLVAPELRILADQC